MLCLFVVDTPVRFRVPPGGPIPNAVGILLCEGVDIVLVELWPCVRVAHPFWSTCKQSLLVAER